MTNSPRESPSPKLVSLAGHHLAAFPGISPTCTCLIASNNPLDSLSTLPTLPHLERLELCDTLIQSFESAHPQTALRMLLLRRSPLGLEPLVTEMALIALSGSLEIVNGSAVRPEQRSFARAGAALRPHLLGGWILRALTPARLVHVRTRMRKTLKVTWSAPVSPTRCPPPDAAAPADAAGLDAIEAEVTELSRLWNRGCDPDPRASGAPRRAALRSASRVKLRRAVSRTARGDGRLADIAVEAPAPPVRRSPVPAPEACQRRTEG
jgi:hypothetical protein